jgi:hypothetical protein
MLPLQASMLVVGVATDLARGMSLGSSLSGETLDMLSTTASAGLPALAFASLFSGIAETMAAAFAGVLTLIVAAYFITGKGNFPLAGPTTGTGVHWVVDTSGGIVYCLGALIVLAIQYLRRRTVRARWVAAAVFALAGIATPRLPWQTAFAIERRIAPASGAAASVVLAFEPLANGTSRTFPAFCIPLTVSGLPADAWLNVDHVSASLMDATGSVVWKTRIELPSIDSSSPFNAIRGYDGCQPLPMEDKDSDRLANTPGLRAQFDYSLTLFGLDKSYAMPAASSGKEQVLPGIGRCSTRVGEHVDLGCMTQHAPTCAMAFLSDTPTGKRSPPVYSCNPNYDPWGFDDGGAWGSGLSIPWRNLSDPQIKNWQLVLKTYKPLDHFTRQVTTPEIKLRDWLPRS